VTTNELLRRLHAIRDEVASIPTRAISDARDMIDNLIRDVDQTGTEDD